MAVPASALTFGMMSALVLVAAALTLPAAALAVFISILMSALVVMPAGTLMMVAMMIAMRIRIVFQVTFRECLCRSVRGSLHTGVKLNARVGQRHLGTHTNPAADQSVDFGCLQETGQCAVAASVSVYNLFADDFPIRHVIHLELFGMTEMLEDLSIIVCDCDSHRTASFLHDFLIEFNWFIFTASACD